MMVLQSGNEPELFFLIMGDIEKNPMLFVRDIHYYLYDIDKNDNKE